MSREIGSEFWLDDECQRSSLKESLPQWIDDFGQVLLTQSGRGAISLLLRQIEPTNKSVLLPAYICDSVILPFIEQGYSCHFYDINLDLSPDIESMCSYNQIGVLVHMGYYGFSTNSTIKNLIQEYKAESTIIIEDVTHTLFSTYARFDSNDYYIASLRKWFGLPSGGMLASATRPLESNLLQNDSNFPTMRRKALELKSKYLKCKDSGLKTSYLSLFSEAESLLEMNVSPHKIDDLSATIVKALDHKALINKRRTNFLSLSDGLDNISSIDKLFTELPKDICPMFYPVILNRNRSQIRTELSQEKIYCPIHWPIPDNCNITKLRNVSRIYDTILSIPCDQRYGEQDMERLLSVLRRLT